MKPGRLTDFVHRPMIDESVKPNRQTFWFAKREPIADKLRRLEQGGVIERVDASPWTSNIVTAKKCDGSLRLYVSDVNKAIILEYPPPTMNELTERTAVSMLTSSGGTRPGPVPRLERARPRLGPGGRNGPLSV